MKKKLKLGQKVKLTAAPKDWHWMDRKGTVIGLNTTSVKVRTERYTVLWVSRHGVSNV